MANTITVTTENNVQINGTSGNDVIDASASHGTLTLSGGAGNDVIISGSGVAVVEGGDGRDTFRLGSVDSNVRVTIADFEQMTPAGKEMLDLHNYVTFISDITYDNGDALISFSTGAAVTLKGITYLGADDLNIGPGDMVFSSQPDILYVSGSGAQQIVTLGGNDVIDLSHYSGNVTVSAGSGDDTIYAGAGYCTVAGGSGNDSFFLSSELSHLLITDFEGVGQGGGDVLDLHSYFSSGADALSHVTYSNGNAVISLGNGNTITLGEVSHLIASDIGIMDSATPDTPPADEGGDNGTEKTDTGEHSGDNSTPSGDGDAGTDSGTTPTDTGEHSGDNSTPSSDGGTSTGGGSSTPTDTSGGAGQNSGNSSGGGGGGRNVTAEPVAISSAAAANGGAGVTLQGTPNADTLTGTAGNDTIIAKASADSVDGGAGADIIYGNEGKDTLLGGDGQDTIFGGQDSDVIFGNQSNDILYGNIGNDQLFGGLGDDWLHGGQGSDMLYGNKGNDLLLGGLGTDWLHGGQGNDTLAGGLGSDTLNGGLGDDVIIFQANDGNDRIEGFEGAGKAGGDILQFEHVFATSEEALAHVAYVEGNAVITAGEGHITLIGVAHLVAEDIRIIA